MRLSYFAKIYNEGENTIIFNTLNKSLLVIDRPIDKDSWKTGKGFDDDEMRMLVECEDFVDDDYSESEEALQRFEDHLCNEDKISLTIHVTNMCNCNCYYCYEHGMYQGYTSFAQLDNLDAFLQQCREKSGIDVIHLSFHGGEPTLFPQIMIDVYNIAVKHFSTIMTTMVSNGVRIHQDEVLNALKAVNMAKVLITVDGDKETHNKRRPMKNGESAYDNIMRSLDSLVENDITRHISVNVDSGNVHCLDYVYKHVIMKYSPNDFYVAKICSGETNKLATVITYPEFSRVKMDFVQRNNIPVEGKDTKYEDFIKTHLCSNKKRYEFVVDSFGDIYKCISMTGDKKFSVGNLEDGYEAISQKIKHDLYKHISGACKRCSYLPICYGGCLLGKHNGEAENGCMHPMLEKALPQVMKWKVQAQSK